MFVHGDKTNNPGSLGCIDIADCDVWFRNWAMTDPSKDIDVYVKYFGKVCN